MTSQAKISSELSPREKKLEIRREKKAARVRKVRAMTRPLAPSGVWAAMLAQHRVFPLAGVWA